MIVVIGAGITGLVAADRLVEAGREVRLLESADRVGGAIQTVRRDGITFEHGPQSVLARAPGTLALVNRLGLRDRVVESTPAARTRFILWDGKLREVPRGLLSRDFMRRRGLLRGLAEPLVRKKAPPDETVAAFAQRRFGRDFAERLVDPFVAGIYAGDATRLEAAATFPDLVAAEDARGSVIVGLLAGPRAKKDPDAPRSLYSLDGGMQTLPDALGARLGDRVRLRTRVLGVERSGAGWAVRTADGVVPAAEVVMTAPPRSIGMEWPETRLAAVHLVFRSADVPAVKGFGWLAPTSQLRDALGCLWVSSAFPGCSPGKTLFRVMIGGARDPGFDADPEALVQRARRVLREIQGVDAEPQLTDVCVARLPQYNVGHLRRVAELQATGIRYAGWGYTGVGVEKCIVAGNKAADALIG